MTKVNSNVPGILILSHGPLCMSLIESAKMIGGDMVNVKALPLEEEVDIAAYAQEAKTILDGMPEGSIVLFDLFCGTPFNQLVMLCPDGKINGLCGANLPMLLEVLALREGLCGAELIKAVEGSIHDSIVNVGEFMKKMAAT